MASCHCLDDLELIPILNVQVGRSSLSWSCISILPVVIMHSRLRKGNQSLEELGMRLVDRLVTTINVRVATCNKT